MKVALVAPRFHTNQAELVRFFLRNDVNVAFCVTGTGKSEDHSDVEPTVIRVSNALGRFVAAVTDRKMAEFIRSYTWGIPTIAAMRNVGLSRGDGVIIRNPFTMVGMTFALYARFRGVVILLYTQRAAHSPRRGFRHIAIEFYIRLLRAAWITPCAGAPEHPRPVRRLYYVPFCARPQAYEKVWFRNGVVNIICVGKFVARKNHLLLLEALAALSDQYRFSLTLVGEVSDVTGSATIESVRERLRSVKFPVELETNVSRERIGQLYGNSDLFVLPARDEPASVSNLEAMAFGLPVITSSSNKTSCYTDNNGFIFLSDSLTDLVRVLSLALSNREDLKRMGKRSVHLVCERHSPDRVYAGVLGFLRGAGFSGLEFSDRILSGSRE